MHWLQHFFGFYRGGGNGTHYLFWSGAGADITELAMLGWLYAFLRKHNCNQHQCWRIGRYAVAGGQYTTCRKHHPDPNVREGIKAHHLLAAHVQHKNRLAPVARTVRPDRTTRAAQ